MISKNQIRCCLDLCSGLGGFSEAFVDGGWDVIRIDVDPKFKDIPFTVIGDVRDLDFVKKTVGNKKVDVILASPPCERFSLACRTFPKEGIMEAMQVVGACLEIVAMFHPKFWVLENPKARLRWFLGSPKGTIRLSDYGAPYLKPTDYWGNINLPMLEKTVPPKIYLRPMKHDPKKPSPIYLSGKGIGKAQRAKMPYGLSKAILEAVEASL